MNSFRFHGQTNVLKIKWIHLSISFKIKVNVVNTTYPKWNRKHIFSGKSVQVASTLLSQYLSPDFNFPRGKSISEVHFLKRLIWRDTFRFVSRLKRGHLKWDTDFCNIRGYAQQQQPPNVCKVWIEKKIYSCHWIGQAWSNHVILL